MVSRSQGGGLVPVLGVVLEEIFHSLSNESRLIPPLQGLQIRENCRFMCMLAM